MYKHRELGQADRDQLLQDKVPQGHVPVRKLVKAGDFVINSRSDRKGSSGLAPLDGSVSLINIVLTPQDVDGRWCNYLFRSHPFIVRLSRSLVFATPSS